MLYLFLAILVVVVIVVMRRPKTFRYERSTHINAAPSVVFPLVSNFHEWRNWSPFEDIDPNLTRIYEGADGGVGAVYKWSGNGQAGEGRMEITEAVVPTVARIRQQFTRPFKMDSTVEFLLNPEGDGTRATWAMFGENSGMSKAMGLFINMDKMLGKEFDKGLARLKAVAESRDGEPSTPAPDPQY